MRVPLRGSDVRRKFIGDEFQGRVVREVEGAALEIMLLSPKTEYLLYGSVSKWS